MGETLRRIALTVEQDGGGYSWLLIESAGGGAGYQELALPSASGLQRRDIDNMGEGAREAANAPAIGFTEIHDAL